MTSRRKTAIAQRVEHRLDARVIDRRVTVELNDLVYAYMLETISPAIFNFVNMVQQGRR